MRDSTKITVGYQFRYILLIYLAAAAIAAMFGLLIFYSFMFMNIAKQIVSVGLIGVEAGMLYTTAKKFAARDIKDYTPLKESKAKGVLFGVSVATLNLILIVAHQIVWATCSSPIAEGGRELIYLGAAIYNIFFNILTFAYSGFVNIQEYGNLGYIAPALMIIVPIAATTLGYIAGCKRFELAENLDKLIYEKDDEEEDTK